MKTQQDGTGHGPEGEGIGNGFENEEGIGHGPGNKMGIGHVPGNTVIHLTTGGSEFSPPSTKSDGVPPEDSQWQFILPNDQSVYQLSRID